MSKTKATSAKETKAQQRLRKLDQNDRKAAQRKRFRDAGLKPKEVWAHVGDWPEIDSLVERLRKRREAE